MEFKFKVDEARVLKMVMDGMGTKEIETRIANEIIEESRQRVKNKLSSNISDYIERRCDDEIRKGLIAIVQRELNQTLTPKNLEKEFKKKDWSRLFEHIVEPVMRDFLEYMISEWMAIDIVISGKKDGKKKTVAVVGTDSYEYRKERR